MYRWKFELVLYSPSIKDISNKFFDWYQSNSSDRIFFWHSWSPSSVLGCVTIPQVDPSIIIGVYRSFDASIPSFLCGSVYSSHIWIPNFWHSFGFISDFPILFPNHKTFPNSIIITSSESRVKAVTPVHIGTFIYSAYSGRNGDTVNSSKVKDIGRDLAPKQYVSAWLSISVADALQIILSWFFYFLLIIQQSPISMLNTALFIFPSSTTFVSQVFVTRFPRWS